MALCLSAARSRILTLSEHLPSWYKFRVYCESGRNIRDIEIRERLLTEVKLAMKNKDSFTATMLRSVLSEIYAADKALTRNVAPSVITTIIRKAAIRRNESAGLFANASRPDLAEKERREAEILTAFLPPPISVGEVDHIICEAIAEQRQHADLDCRKNIGQILKRFYARADKTSVDSGLVKRRVEELWSSSSQY